MGKVKVCGKICHNAKGAKCRCWCGGLFHGSGGRDAREAFVEEFALERLPTTERAFNEQISQPDLFTDPGAPNRWHEAIKAAVGARSRKRDAA